MPAGLAAECGGHHGLGVSLQLPCWVAAKHSWTASWVVNDPCSWQAACCASVLAYPTPTHPAEYGTGPAAYVNRYRNAWPAALTNIALAVEDAKRRRGRGELKVPTGTCGGLVVTELPAPMAAFKFSWEQPQVGAAEPLGRELRVATAALERQMGWHRRHAA